MDLNEAKELLEENGYILESNYLDEGIFDSIKNKFFKKKEAVPEVKPQNKKLYDDQIAKTSQQAYNHTTESMSVLKQVATNFNGKKASEFKQLWSGLSKLLNKHGMSVKNHPYYLGVTNNNAEFSVWAYIANPETDWTDIKIIGRVKANVSEYKYTTNYDLDDSSLKGQAEDLNEWLVELDSIALKLFKGASREEWEEGAHQNESVNKAKKLLESVGYIVEDTETDDDEYDALTDEMEKDPTWWKNDLSKSLKTKLNKRTKLYNKHANLEDKVNRAANFNIKNLFYGVEKELKKVYKKVEIEASDYDDENKSQLVRYYYTFNKKTYNLEVLYRDEDDVINVQLFADDWYGHERDDFSVSTIDDAIKQIIEFAHYNTV